MTKRAVNTVALLGLACVLAPGEALAQGSGPDLSGYAAIILSVGVIGGGVAIGGLVTDGLVVHDLVAGQGVRRGPAIAGTVLWGMTAAVMLPL